MKGNLASMPKGRMPAEGSDDATLVARLAAREEAALRVRVA